MCIFERTTTTKRKTTTTTATTTTTQHFHGVIKSNTNVRGEIKLDKMHYC
jgi:hypothetical protein